MPPNLPSLRKQLKQNELRLEKQCLLQEYSLALYFSLLQAWNVGDQFGQHLNHLRDSLAAIEVDLDFKSQQLEQAKDVTRAVMQEAGRLRGSEGATVAAIAAMTGILSENEEVTDDSVFGLGRDFDDTRAFLDTIPRTIEEESMKATGAKRGVGYMDGNIVAACSGLGVKEGSDGRDEDHKGGESTGRREKRAKVS